MAHKLLWIVGLSLIALWAAIHGWSLYARDAGVQAITHARQQLSTVGIEPDTTSWSPQRVAAYHDASRDDEMPLALLRVPSLDLVVPVFEGTDEWALNRGVGRIAGTATLSSPGNVGIAGHRDGFFRPLKNIRIGDLMLVDTATTSMSYRVTRISIVAPKNIGVLLPTPNPSLTLVTCYPFYYIGPAPQRYIVHALRIEPSEATDQASRVEQRSQAGEQHADGADQR